MEEQVELRELVQLCAVDSILFERTFFQRTFRQGSPPFSREISEMLDGPSRYDNIIVFRGGAKTTKLRAFAAKRMAYGISRTIVYIGKSEGHALRSARWLRMQIERNAFFAQTFGLRKGGKWQDHEFEVLHGVEEHPINVVALGITGSTRGINIDDYRPDLIILDDVMSDENAATPEQRQKIDRLIYGALWESLAPASENPRAKLASLATPQNQEDYTTKARNDPQWKTVIVPCWTNETKDLPLEYQESAWPERWTSEVLREEKRAAMRRNQLSIFSREKECKLTTPESATFLPTWIQRFDILPKSMIHIICVDPVPPPSPTQVAKGLHGKDNEAMAVVGFAGGNYYLREIMSNKGHDPSWSQYAFMYLARKYRVRKAPVEMVAYQRTLKWILEQAMREARYWVAIEDIPGVSTSKFNKIVQGLTDPCALGAFFIPPDHAPEGLNNSPGMANFIEQFISYPNVVHDDELEVVANALSFFQKKFNGVGADDDLDDLDDEELQAGRLPAIPGVTICP